MVYLTLRGSRYTWSSHENVLVLSRIDHFLFSIKWEGHFQGMHQAILPKIMSNHFPILLRMGTTFIAKRPFKFENVQLKVEDFSDFVNAIWDDFNAYGSSSFVLAKKLTFL